MKISVTQNLPKASTLSPLLLEKLRALLLITLAMLFVLSAYAQNNIVVKGRITNEKNQPLAGVSVVVKGTVNGTSTDAAGNFQISAPSNATLLISSIGYPTKEIEVGNQSTINLILNPSSTDMEQVVVVGYGTQRRKEVTGSVVSVNETALRDVPVPNLQQALQGRAAGLEVQKIGNQPGANAQIRIRGLRSINGSNDPLVILDGIQFNGSLNDINPNDIASVDILKDASATAQYGSRGANGVILLTTKRGRSGETRVSYNGYHGIGAVANPFPVFNAAEYQAMRNISPWGNGYLPAEQAGIAKGTDTDWQDLMYEKSYRTDHNITVTGGANGNLFSLGAGYFKETTVLPGEDFTRGSIRASVETKVGKRLRLGITSQNSLSIANGSQFVSGSPLFRTLAMTPLTSPYDSAGNLNLKPAGNLDDINGSDRYTPLLLKTNNDNWVDRVRRIRTFNTLFAEVSIIEGLKYRFNLGLNYDQQHNAQFRSADQASKPSYFRPAQGNTATVTNGEAWSYTAENIVTYDKVIANKHKFNLTGVYNIQEYQTYNNSITKDSITDDFIKWYNLALSTPVDARNTQMSGTEIRWALISYVAKLNYAFDGKYLLSMSFTRDGSSRLATGNKWFNYPAISAGWVISDEDFMRPLGWVNSLKFRAGYGKVSSPTIDPYQSLGLVNNSNGLTASGVNGVIRYNYGQSTIVTGYNVVQLRNPDLSWEFTRTYNFGLDFSLLNNRLTGSIERYIAKTSDILYRVTLPVTSGVAGSYPTNVGEMENRGWELSLSSVNYTSRTGFNWSTDLNLFVNKNKIVKLSSEIKQDIGNQLFVGEPMSAIYDFNNLGIWQTWEAAEAAQFGAVPGQLKLQDVSGPNGKPDGIINADYDRYVIGDGDADLQGGLTNRFSYKGFDLSAVLYARFGGMVISQVHQPNAAYLTIMDGRRNTLKVDYWTPTNPSNWFPMPQTQISNVSSAWTTLGYYSGTFVKVRSINLGYTFNRNLLRGIGAESIRVYASMDNVAVLFSPYYNKTGIDPEGTGVGPQGVSNPGNIRAGNNGTLTIGLGTPPRRTVTFGLNITL